LKKLLSLLALIILPITVSGCSFLKELPLAKIVSGVQDATLIVDQIEHFVGAFFKARPNPDLEADVSDALTKTRGALIALQRAGEGIESLSDEKYLEALGDFRAAYEELTKVMSGLPGFSLAKPGETTFRAGPGELVVPEPMVLAPTPE
jgi:hypothetical protein